jgi:GR25 family glycosyltransferase involved in LPS biosynthesis
MKHFWINMDNSAMRRNFMDTQFSTFGIDNTRISAVTPNDFSTCLAHNRPLTCKHPGCTSCEYEFACISSHIKAMKYALETSKDNHFVIMEDDIIIPYIINYDNIVNDAPNDFDILQLLILYGPTVKYLYENLYLKNNVKYIKWKYLLPSTGMYIISRKGAEKLVNRYYKNNKYDFNDCEYQIVADVALYQSVNTYATTFPTAYPNINMGSEIHPDHLDAHNITIKNIKQVVTHMRDNNNIPYKK